MSFLDFFKPKFDPYKLTEDEERLSELFLNIIYQVKSNRFADIIKERDILILLLYKHTFIRANVKVYDLTEVNKNPLFFMENKNAIAYVGVYNVISKMIKGLLDQHTYVLTANKKDTDQTILMILKGNSERVKNL